MSKFGVAKMFRLHKLTWEEGSVEMDGCAEMDGFVEGIDVGHCDTLLGSRSKLLVLSPKSDFAKFAN